jgi:hypothetical protein
MPTNYLKDIPDFDKIVFKFKDLHKRQPTLQEVKEIQAIWNAAKESGVSAPSDNKRLL